MSGLSYKDREKIRGIIEYLSSVSPGFLILARRFGLALEEGAETAYFDAREATIVIPREWWEPKGGRPSVKELGALIFHEALHGVLGHWIPLMEKRVEPIIWNIAADAETNQVLEEAGMLNYLHKLVKERLKVGEPVTKAFLRDKLGVPVEDEDAAETVYSKLLDRVKIIRIPIFLDLGRSVAKAEGEREGERKKGDGKKEKKRTILWEGDQELKKNLKEAVKENPARARTALTELLAEMIEASKTAGREIASLERKLKELTQPKIRWTALVRTLIQEGLGKRRRTWRRINRRRIPYIPGDVKLGGRIWFLVDTSGSISDDELREFASEIYAASKLAKELKIVVWESSVLDVFTVKSKSRLLSILKEKLRGGGGTVVMDALDYTYKNMRYGDAVVILSDGVWYDEEDHNVKRLLNLIRMKSSVSLLVTTHYVPNAVREARWKVIQVKT